MISGISGGGGYDASAIQALRQQLFQKADTDQDGKLTKAELEAAKPKDAPPGAPGADQLIKLLDTDKDGSLSEAEFTAEPKQRPSVNPALLALQEVTSDEDDDSEEESLITKLFKELDTDKNGSLSEAEFTAGPKARQTEETGTSLAEQLLSRLFGKEGGSSTRTSMTAYLLTFQEV